MRYGVSKDLSSVSLWAWKKAPGDYIFEQRVDATFSPLITAFVVAAQLVALRLGEAERGMARLLLDEVFRTIFAKLDTIREKRADTCVEDQQPCEVGTKLFGDPPTEVLTDRMERFGPVFVTEESLNFLTLATVLGNVRVKYRPQ